MFAVFDFYVYIFKCVFVRAGIFKRYIYEFDVKIRAVKLFRAVCLAVCAFDNLKVNPCKRQDFCKFAERVCNQHNAVYYLHKSTAVHNERAYVKQPEVAFYTDKNIHTKRNKRTHNGNNRACFCRA